MDVEGSCQFSAHPGSPGKRAVKRVCVSVSQPKSFGLVCVLAATRRSVWFVSWTGWTVAMTGHDDSTISIVMVVIITVIIKGQPSVLWRCWLGGRKGIRPVKYWVVGCWHGVCLKQGADLHMAQLMPLPLTVSCFSKIQIGFYLSGTGWPG